MLGGCSLSVMALDDCEGLRIGYGNRGKWGFISALNIQEGNYLM